MRITRLDLLRYGKFTDRSVELPHATRDFHLIVGPNEAGKSTLRSAIQDLLFGIETRSRYNFIHPHNEMRLGALIEQGAEALDFVRIKARNKTLQTAAGKPLPDDALLPFLGPLDRSFFDQMFGLDHGRLVTGGREILDAANDVGQILFQAAAGVGSLGEVRDRLEKEADGLWAKRKSNDRRYYRAANELETAEAALKHATVRTKEWAEARARVDDLATQLDEARSRYQSLEQERIQLERVRRVAPLLIALADLEARQADLGAVVALPENAAALLAEAEREMALAEQSAGMYRQQATALQEQWGALSPDEAILARADDIAALAEKRVQVSQLPGDIAQREQEIRVLWDAVEAVARELGWPAADEATLRQRLPGGLVRSAIDHLLRKQDSLRQAVDNARALLRQREDEARALAAELAALHGVELPAGLRDALGNARALGDVGKLEKSQHTTLARLQREQQAALAELGSWAPGPDVLRALMPPSADEANALIKQRGDLENALAAQSERLAEASGERAALTLEIAQYQAAHHPVTQADIAQLRTERDGTWLAIKAGAMPLATAAGHYEQQVAAADGLADRRHDKAQEAAEMQTRLDRLQRLVLQVTDWQARQQGAADALVSFDRSWEARTHALGLAGLPLLRLNAWRNARDKVLQATDALLEAQHGQGELTASVAGARAALAAALRDIAPAAETPPLDRLIERAEARVQDVTRAQENHRHLSQQKLRADHALPELRGRLTQAEGALTAWQVDLAKQLALAHLPADANPGAIEKALTLFEGMHQHLEKIHDLRAKRISPMRQELAEFGERAKSLRAATVIAADAASDGLPADQIALELERRLKAAQSAARELARLKAEGGRLSGLAQEAQSRLAAAKAGLAPLLQQAGTADHAALRQAIERSDAHRALHGEAASASRQLLQAGDGLDRVALHAECQTGDAASAEARLGEIKRGLQDIVAQQNRLSGELTAAERDLGKIAGQDEAARAEAKRQEALADMTGAAERFVKVHVAARLLRWSIERFRESKQGPMLSRASEIFQGLTRGAFDRLKVDYESDPVQLYGRRDNGSQVAIEGMSEGTRDQLYLALRLAALELHLAQTIPLPFIADDLFINYDDGRSTAGIEALARLSEMTQVIFLSHHAHLVPVAQAVLGERLNVVTLS